ncbi:Stage V sporulation protein T, AbrB family transcriptional regulator (SpoVT) [Lachnospiraceae bacterium TWA4]|nr:Stage V sporulation protein T, AbrB family transcriptional regulator (SpoVT) [Lachnospiraceae bacterium TWA4]
MKATGIIRKIDDLGRIVLPKEIRRTLRLREGTPLEIFTDREGEVILKKYSPMDELNGVAKPYAESLAQVSGFMVCITDRDQVIAVAGGLSKDFIGKLISKELEDLICERNVLVIKKNESGKIPIVTEDARLYNSQVIYPIICEADVIGTVCLLGKNSKLPVGETEKKLVAATVGFLGKQMES